MIKLTLFLFTTLLFEVQGEGAAPLWTLNDGRKVPSFGLGTSLGLSTGSGIDNSVEEAVGWAIDAGYRHIDTAAIYKTEEQVGRAVNKKIKDGVVKREDVFITTKLWGNAHARSAVLPALRESLSKLGLDYVDLYLIHWPVSLHPNGTISNEDYVDTWKGMVEARELGLARSIGVSNFNQQQLERLLSSSEVKPAMLQVEVNLNLQQPSLLAYCRSQNILVTAYTPFGSLFPSKAKANAPPPRIDTPALVELAKKHNKTTTQLNLRYLVELGVIPIPKSTTKSRIEQNIDVFDFQLTPEDKELLKSYDKHYRTIPVLGWKDSPFYPFELDSKQ